jgi:predicted transport protein
VSRWICPRCEREFARARQAHTCLPGVTVDQTFAGRPAEYREIYDALMAHLRTLGPVHEDAVSVGVFLKHEDKFVEVRPKARSLSIWLMLPREAESARFTRRERISIQRVAHLLALRSIKDVDDQLRGWLTEAYDAAG